MNKFSGLIVLVLGILFLVSKSLNGQRDIFERSTTCG